MTHAITEEKILGLQKPWQKLGRKVEGMTVDQAMETGGLDWQVEKRQLYYDYINAEGAGTKEATDSFATIRTDTDGYLGTVGKQYQPLQNTEQAELIQAIVGEGEACAESVGSYANDRKVFWTCKLSSDMLIGENDRIEKYLVLQNSHDGSGSFRAFYSPLRVVCSNMLTGMIKKFGKNGISLRHTKNAIDKIQEAKRVLCYANEQFLKTEEYYNEMAQVKIDTDRNKMDDIIDRIFGRKADEEVTTRWENEKYKIKTAIREENSIATEKNTAWTIYNGITRYTNHYQSVKDSGKRFDNLLSGRASTVASNALSVLAEMN